ncbi:hypothetical protein M569_07694 [Genlisea aurea]|uniref:Myb-like domain-containing protein n=1 Tax=Genlisea aurea TaxID=192259 RepID=S8DV89_9LAMI|nr:hypothetical protein M569_07694 [Genlisea aurea]
MLFESLSPGRDPVDGGAGSKAAAARLPRWTQKEILVLIQGKRAAENRVGIGPASTGSGQISPKWCSISNYCVNRCPAQCRKRWSNLSGDFRKIKAWESEVKEGSDSFWAMRKDSRRERKLPGSFDREVYDILSGADAGQEGVGRSSVKRKWTAPIPISGLNCAISSPRHSIFITAPEKHYPSEDPPRAGREKCEFEYELVVAALESNGRLLRPRLEAQNANLRLEREQRDEHLNRLSTVLDKVADAVCRIADKL